MFRSELVESRAQSVVQSDLLAALSVAMKPSSPKVLMNASAAEIALVLGGLSAKVILTQRVWSVLNYEAHALSRLSQGTSLPASLVNATCLPVPPRNDLFNKAWSWEPVPT